MRYTFEIHKKNTQDSESTKSTMDSVNLIIAIMVGLICIIIFVTGHQSLPHILNKLFERPTVEISIVSASSILPPSTVAKYDPKLVTDGNSDTVWVENVSGYGIDEWIQLTFSEPYKITEIKIIGGYDKGVRMATRVGPFVAFLSGHPKSLK